MAATFSGWNKELSNHINNDRIKTYTDLSQIGCTLNDDILTIAKHLPDDSEITYYVDGSEGNFAHYPQGWLMCKITKIYASSQGYFYALCNPVDGNNNFTWYGIGYTHGNTWSGWKKIVSGTKMEQGVIIDNNYTAHDTILGIACSLSASGTFMVISSSSLANAPDAPFPGVETHYLVLVDVEARRQVIAFSYGTNLYIKTRAIFNSAWLGDMGWQDVITDRGGNLKKALSFNGMGIIQQYDSSFEFISFLKDSQDRTQLVVSANMPLYHSFSVNRYANGVWSTSRVYHEGNVTKGTSDIGAGNQLAEGCIYLQYE